MLKSYIFSVFLSCLCLLSGAVNGAANDATISNVTYDSSNGSSEAGRGSSLLAVSVTLTASHSFMSETGGTSTLTATLDNTTFEDVTVSLAYSGTALSGTDYQTPASSIVINAGQTSGTALITAISDGLYEGPETILVDITAVNGGAVGQALVSIDVNSTNDGPVAQSQTITVSEDGIVQLTLQGSDEEGDTLSFTLQTTPARPTLLL
jgi:hypothetical protein